MDVRPARLTLAVKRAMDVAGSAAALLVLSPALLVIAAAVRATLGAPVLYRQERPGLRERPIRVWKFRTMTDARDERGRLRPDGERLTRLGRVLREYSLDELPQFLNVLRGELSLVGPRPLLTRYLPRYTARQRRRHAVTPGMTGWAQVNGRNALDWESRLELDVWYAEHRSLALDVKIMLLTVARLVQRRDVLPGAGAELEEFWGTQGPPAEGPRAYPVEERERAGDAPPATSLLITGLGQGGAETQLVALARDLKGRGWDVEIVSLLPPARHAADTRRFLAELQAAEIVVWSPGIVSPATLVRGLAALGRRWRARRPEVLCTFMFHANVVGRVLGRLAGIPVIVSSIRNERFGPRWRERLEAVTERLGDVTVVNSQAVAESLAARGVLRRDRCRVIPNAVDLARFAPRQAPSRELVRARLGIPREAFLWLAVGRLDPHKDHAGLLRALAIVRARHPSVRLAIAGAGPLREPLGRQAQELGLEREVAWLGLRDDVPDLLAASDALVLASRWEGSPNVVLEALAAGVPVAATDVGGVRELVEDGRSGFVVPPAQVGALATAMERLMNRSPQARRQMGRHGRDSIRQRHEASAILEQWRRLVSEAWARRAATPPNGAPGQVPADLPGRHLTA